MKIGVMFGNPETTTGGNALKFYASVRLDIRRIGAIKHADEVVGSRTKVQGREEQGRAAVPRGRVRHPLRHRHLQGGRAGRPRHRARNRREERGLVLVRRRAHRPGPREREGVPQGEPRNGRCHRAEGPGEVRARVVRPATSGNGRQERRPALDGADAAMELERRSSREACAHRGVRRPPEGRRAADVPHAWATCCRWKARRARQRATWSASSTALLDDYHRRSCATELQVDLAYAQPELGRFRVNIFRQRGELSIVHPRHPAAGPHRRASSTCRRSSSASRRAARARSWSPAPPAAARARRSPR